VASVKEIILFEQETDVNDDSHERELSMDELDVVSAGGSAPRAQLAKQVGCKAADMLKGIVDDSV
jgi:hypothetical protein